MVGSSQRLLLLSASLIASVTAFGVVPPSSSTSFGVRRSTRTYISTAPRTTHEPTRTIVPTKRDSTSLYYATTSNSPCISLEECRLDEFMDCNRRDAETAEPTTQNRHLGISLNQYMKDVKLSQETEEQMNEETRENIKRIVDNGIKELNQLSCKLQRDVAHPHETHRVQWDRAYQKNEKALRQQLDNVAASFLKDTQRHRQETHDQVLIDEYMGDTYTRQAQALSHGISRHYYKSSTCKPLASFLFCEHKSDQNPSLLLFFVEHLVWACSRFRCWFSRYFSSSL